MVSFSESGALRRDPGPHDQPCLGDFERSRRPHSCSQGPYRFVRLFTLEEFCRGVETCPRI